MKLHLFRHFNIRNFSCPYCDLTFVCENNQIRHINCFHLKNKCGTCKKVMGKFETLENHDCKLGQFLCKYCDKVFFYSSTLRRHLRGFHLNLKCKNCFTIFSSQEMMDSHDCTKYKCESCKRIFRYKGEFSDHKCSLKMENEIGENTGSNVDVTEFVKPT